jgi:predicted short-subunit dehydrogenase-like oxidoreductase (DUF2520 family)
MRKTLAIIGAGRVGRALGRKLHEAGWRITTVVARSEANAREAVRHIGAGQPHRRLTRLVLEAETVLVAVPDDEVSRLAERLARMGGEEWRGKVVLHTSGALDHRALAHLEKHGAVTGSIHPMQTFSVRVAPPLQGVWMVMEGKPAAIRVARRIARDLGGVPIHLRSEDKQTYHAAGVFAAAHVLALVETGRRILAGAGLTRRPATRALLALSRQVLQNYERFGAHEAWTGPAARGDFKTVAGHAQALKRFPPEYGEAYAAAHRLGARVLAQRPGAVLAKLESVLPPSGNRVKGRRGR